MNWLDVDAAVTVEVNSVHLIDDTDFKTREESVVYNQSGLDLTWIFITTAGVITQTAVTPTDTGGVYDWTALLNGFYKIEIPASGGGTINNDAEGFGHFEGFATGILPWIGPTYGFRLAALNNDLVDGTLDLEAQVAAALVAIKLDHLIAVSESDEPVDDSLWARMLDAGSTADYSNYINTEDSQRAISEKVSGIGSASGGGFNFAPLSDDVLEDTIDDAAAVDKSTSPATVGIPVTGAEAAGWLAGDECTIAGSTNYEGQHVIDSVSTNEIIIVSAFTAETFSSDTIKRTIKATRLVGTQASGTFASVAAQDGVVHQIAHDTNTFTISYRYDVGGGRIATESVFTGFLNSGNDNGLIQAWNFVSGAWETRATFDGQNGSVNQTITAPLLARNTGTSGVELGQVLMRIKHGTAATSQTLNTDSLLVEAVAVGQSVGYDGGAIWIDSVNGTPGTESFVNGVADNPVADLPDAFALSTALKLKNLVITPGSSVTLAQSPTGFVISAALATLNGGSQDAAGTRINGGLITGIWTHSSGAPFLMSTVNVGPGGATVSLEAHVLLDCGLAGTVKLTSTDTVFWIGTFATTATPTLDFNSVGGATVNIMDHKGPLTVINMSASDVLNAHFLDGGLLTIAGVDGTATISGSVQVTDNRTGSPVLTDNTLDTAHGTLLARTVDLVAHIAKFTGITKVGEWLGIISGKQAGDATALAEMKLTGAGSGSLDPTTDSLEAVRDRGDAAWITGNTTTPPTVAAIADAVLDELTAGHTTAGSLSKAIIDILADSNEIQGDQVDGGRLDLIWDAIKVKTDLQPAGVQKNVALANFSFLMVDATDFATPETGLSVTATISKDGGGFNAATNSVSEIANGVYKISLTQTEMNADIITLKFTASGAAQRTIVMTTSG